MSGAQQFVNWYDGIHGYDTVYSRDVAIYPGSGTVEVCAHTYYYGTGTTISRYCAPDVAAVVCQPSGEDNISYHVGNDSAYYHQIDGGVDDESPVCE